MAQMSFETAKALEETRSQSSGDYEFFTLKNDGDEAIVRFMHDSTASFPIFTLHQVTVGGKKRKISCVRDPRAPLSDCPLCNSGNKVANSFFIHMLVYRKDETGKMVGYPAIWERSLSYATKLKSMLDEYGPLSECLFKVKRNGAAGSMDTTYDMFFCNPRVYSDEIYTPNPEAFKDVSLTGSLILDKSEQDIQVFLNTGSFPSTAPASDTPAAVQPQDNESAITVGGGDYEPKQAPAVSATQPVAQGPATGMGRPNRYY